MIGELCMVVLAIRRSSVVQNRMSGSRYSPVASPPPPKEHTTPDGRFSYVSCDILGRGNSVVYRGIALETGAAVAIKKVSMACRLSIDDLPEVRSLRSIPEHRNVLPRPLSVQHERGAFHGYIISVRSHSFPTLVPPSAELWTQRTLSRADSPLVLPTPVKLPSLRLLLQRIGPFAFPKSSSGASSRRFILVQLGKRRRRTISPLYLPLCRNCSKKAMCINA